MSNIHGRPCWFELATSDLDGAKAFYEKVLGWTVIDSGMEAMTYWLAVVGGDGADGSGVGTNVAGLYPNDAMGDEVPVSWLIYIGVDDCDRVAAKAGELGGGTVAPPADIPGTGRFAVLVDPNGAAFGVLQPDGADDDAAVTFGTGPGNEGRACWIDLVTVDVESSLPFYTELFGWDTGDVIPVPDSEAGYQTIEVDGIPIGGMGQMASAPMAFWGVHFQVADADAAVSAIKGADGTVLGGPMEVPGGARIAAATDPQGAAFSITGNLP